MRILDDIIGKEVLDSTAIILGKVKDIELDTASKNIESIIVTKSGISESIGISKSEMVIPFEIIKYIGDKVLLKQSHDKTKLILENIEKEL